LLLPVSGRSAPVERRLRTLHFQNSDGTLPRLTAISVSRSIWKHA
jgi:hypothetical protein